VEEIVVVIACLLLNAILAGAEMAFVSVGRPELRAYAAQGSKRAKVLLRLREKPERILSVLQIGITLVGAVAAAVSGVGAQETFGPWLQHHYGLSPYSSEILAVVAIVLPLTYLNVVFGELVPKAISMKHPLAIALVAAPWLRTFDRVLSPIVSLLEKSTKLFVRIFLKPREEIKVTTDDIVELGELQTHTKQYILNMIHAEKKTAQEVMVPWHSVQYIQREASLQEAAKIILESHHTRLPVMSGNELVGLVHSKDFLALLKRGNEDWQTLIHPVVRVRLRESVLEIFIKLQRDHGHLAVVFDRLEIVGVITLEDIVEEIMGNLYQEDDDAKFGSLLGSRNPSL